MSATDAPMTQEQIAALAEEMKLVPDTILCAVDVKLANEIFKSGRTGDASVDYLRWIDLGIETREGRIEGDDLTTQAIHKGQGLSFFIKKVLPKGMSHLESGKLTGGKKKQLKALYDNIKQANWWKLETGTTLPAGLILIYDGDPPGHCTLSPDREMTVQGFLDLVGQVTFTPCGQDILGIKKQ